MFFSPDLHITFGCHLNVSLLLVRKYWACLVLGIGAPKWWLSFGFPSIQKKRNTSTPTKHAGVPAPTDRHIHGRPQAAQKKAEADLMAQIQSYATDRRDRRFRALERSGEGKPNPVNPRQARIVGHQPFSFWF